MPNRMPERISDYMPDKMPNRTPQRMPDGISEYLPDIMLDRMLHSVCQIGWTKMVGITQCKYVLRSQFCCYYDDGDLILYDGGYYIQPSILYVTISNLFWWGPSIFCCYYGWFQPFYMMVTPIHVSWISPISESYHITISNLTQMVPSLIQFIWSNMYILYTPYIYINIYNIIIYIYTSIAENMALSKNNHWNWEYVVKIQPSSSKIFSIWVYLLSLSLYIYIYVYIYILECQLFEHPRELYQHVLAHTEVHRLESTCKTPGSLRMGHLTDRAEEVRGFSGGRGWRCVKEPAKNTTGLSWLSWLWYVVINDLAGIC